MTRFEEVIKEMESSIAEIEKHADNTISRLLDESQKEKVSQLANKTTAAIKTTMDKVTDVVKSVGDTPEISDFLDKVSAKCKDTTAFTMKKISEFKPKVDLNKVFLEIDGLFDRVVDNENVKNAASFVKDIAENVKTFYDTELKESVEKAKDNVVSFYNEELKDSVEKAKETAVSFYNNELKDSIEAAKATTLGIAEKGVDGLKKMLRPEETETEEKSEECCCKSEEEKECCHSEENHECCCKEESCCCEEKTSEACCCEEKTSETCCCENKPAEACCQEEKPAETCCQEEKPDVEIPSTDGIDFEEPTL